MDKYDYLKAVEADALEAIKELKIKVTTKNMDELQGTLIGEFWTRDSVTGGGSGSYTFNTWEAEECLCHNLDWLEELNDEMGMNLDVLKDGPETCDVAIRQYLLPLALRRVLARLAGRPIYA